MFGDEVVGKVRKLILNEGERERGVRKVDNLGWEKKTLKKLTFFCKAGKMMIYYVRVEVDGIISRCKLDDKVNCRVLLCLPFFFK